MLELSSQDRAFVEALSEMPQHEQVPQRCLKVLHAYVVKDWGVVRMAREWGQSETLVSRKLVEASETMLFKATSEMRYALTVAYGRALARADSFECVIAEIAAWGAVTFPDSTAESTFRHLQREMRELKESDEWDGEEMADLFHLVVQLARVTGKDLAAEVRRKFAINQAREWQAPDAEGVVEHVR